MPCRALHDLIDRGQDDTEELYLFYSGHGFCFEESAHEQATDILVTSDFVDRGRTGDCCSQLGEIRSRLYMFLGGKHHYHFIDACRTVIKERNLEPGRLSLTFPRRAANGSPTTYVLFSTAVGAALFTNSGFAERLLEGLNGAGRAKDYARQGKLFVKFPLVAKYVRDHLAGQQPAEEKKADGEVLILEIKPIPVYRGKIIVEGAKPTDRFQLVNRIRTIPRFVEQEEFQGMSHEFDYVPSDLAIEVHDGNRLLRRSSSKAWQLLLIGKTPCHFRPTDCSLTASGSAGAERRDLWSRQRIRGCGTVPHLVMSARRGRQQHAHGGRSRELCVGYPTGGGAVSGVRSRMLLRH